MCMLESPTRSQSLTRIRLAVGRPSPPISEAVTIEAPGVMAVVRRARDQLGPASNVLRSASSSSGSARWLPSRSIVGQRWKISGMAG